MIQGFVPEESGLTAPAIDDAEIERENAEFAAKWGLDNVVRRCQEAALEQELSANASNGGPGMGASDATLMSSRAASSLGFHLRRLQKGLLSAMTTAPSSSLSPRFGFAQKDTAGNAYSGASSSSKSGPGAVRATTTAPVGFTSREVKNEDDSDPNMPIEATTEARRHLVARVDRLFDEIESESIFHVDGGQDEGQGQGQDEVVSANDYCNPQNFDELSAGMFRRDESSNTTNDVMSAESRAEEDDYFMADPPTGAGAGAGG